MNTIDNILKEIQALTLQESYAEANVKFSQAILDAINTNRTYLGELYYHYAHFLLSINEYELSLNAFESAYKLNFMQDEIKRILFDCYINPNMHEFKSTYHQQISSISNNIMISNSPPDFDELPLAFLPCSEDKYFIFNNSTDKFEGVLDISDSTIENIRTNNFDDELSDIVISNAGSLLDAINIIISANNRIIYYIDSDYNKLLSFLKIPKIVEKLFNHFVLFDNLIIFQEYFHINKSVYLPRLFSAQSDSELNKIKNIVEIEHAYRLTPEGRDKSRVILTIAMPTYNRGYLALEHILDLMALPFDAEIEFVVSNNCSTKYCQEYDKIKNLSDSRINYYESPINIGGNMNFCKVIGLAYGQYVCLLSDEDIIYLPSVSHYLSVMKNNPNISFIMASNFSSPPASASQLYSHGAEAFLKSFLTSNYITGLIYRKDLYAPLNLYSWTEKNILENNKAFCNYSQTCWTAAYTLHGDYCFNNVPLYSIGTQLDDDVKIVIDNSVMQSEKASASDKNETLTLVYYSTLESRIEQHNGFIELLNQLSQYISEDTYIKAYKMLIDKTFFLIYCVKDQYDEAHADWSDICMKISYCCVDGIPKLHIAQNSNVQEMLLDVINTNYLYYSSL